MQAWSNVLQACLLLAKATARLASCHSFSKGIWIKSILRGCFDNALYQSRKNWFPGKETGLGFVTVRHGSLIH